MTGFQELSTSEVEEALGSVLSRAEFAERSIPEVLEWSAAIRRAIAEFFQGLLRGLLEFLNSIEGLRNATPILFTILVTGTVILLLLLARHSWRVLRERARARALVAPPSDPLSPPSRDLEAWETLASRALAEGRTLDAAHAMYAALILRLESRGIIEAEASKTPGDYRREARRRDAREGRLVGRFVSVFEPLVFGGRTPEEAPVKELAELARSGGVRV